MRRNKRFPAIAFIVFVAVSCAFLPHPRDAIVSMPAEAPILVHGRPPGESLDRLLLDRISSPEELPHLKELIRIDQAVTGRPLYAGNGVTLLIDGPMTFESMFSEMEKARHHIHIETFILDDERIGQRFADIMIARRKAGVAVRIVYDAFGVLGTEEAYFNRLRENGVELFKYNPINPLEDPRIWRINQRHHRKIMIVDGRVAFTGGMNISGVYSRSSFSPPGAGSHLKDRWRDTHIRLEGPVVEEFQRLFVDLWAELHNSRPLGGPDYFPRLERAGPALVRVTVTTHNPGDHEIYSVYISLFAKARRRIWVTQGYFSPDPGFLRVLKAAARNGVDVRLLLPGATDSWLTISSSRASYSGLLKAGVRIFERRDALQHAKTAVVDGIWSTVGSANLDYRSFLHANEANAIIYGEIFGRRMEELFLADQEKNEEIIPEAWERRSWGERLKEIFGSFFVYWL